MPFDSSTYRAEGEIQTSIKTEAEKKNTTQTECLELFSDEQLRNSTVPQIQAGNLLSIGSREHSSQECKPCVFFNTNKTCVNGFSCWFCHHLDGHENHKRPRLSRKKRLQLKKLNVEKGKAKDAKVRYEKSIQNVARDQFQGTQNSAKKGEMVCFSTLDKHESAQLPNSKLHLDNAKKDDALVVNISLLQTGIQNADLWSIPSEDGSNIGSVQQIETPLSCGLENFRFELPVEVYFEEQKQTVWKQINERSEQHWFQHYSRPRQNLDPREQNLYQ